MALAVYAYVFAVGQVSNNAKHYPTVVVCRKPSFIWLLRVGSTYSSDDKAVGQNDFLLSGRYPARCRPSMAITPTAAVADHCELPLRQVSKRNGRFNGSVRAGGDFRSCPDEYWSSNLRVLGDQGKAANRSGSCVRQVVQKGFW